MSDLRKAANILKELTDSVFNRMGIINDEYVTMHEIEQLEEVQKVVNEYLANDVNKENEQALPIANINKCYDKGDMRAVADGYDSDWQSFDSWLEEYDSPL